MKYLLLALSLVAAGAQAQTIIDTHAWQWRGDSMFQAPFYATAPSPTQIVSTYHAQPGYYMPIEQTWTCRNDLTLYPALTTSNTLQHAIYNMGLDEMINNVEPDTTLRTGKEWAGVWTRDVSYSIILSMAYLQPEASKVSLMKKVNANGVIIQDTGSGGAWPVSTDRLIWASAAWEVYKVTGEKAWLEYIYPVIAKSIAVDEQTVFTGDSGLPKGETSFIDWREQSYPKWMQCADIYNSEALGTSVVFYHAYKVLADCARELGKKADAQLYDARAEKIARAINEYLWMPDKGYYAMYRYGRNYLITNPRAETLGESLAILWGVAGSERARSITENNPVTPYGAAIFYPQISDMPAYHNNALWPFVGSYWALANAKAGNEEGTLLAIGAVYRPAALFATNKENFNLDNGDIATELNSSNMLWSLSGNLAITYRILFGVNFETDGLRFTPFIPKALSDTRTLTNFKYRNCNLTITVEGFGDKIDKFIVNGKEQKEPFISAKTKGDVDVRIVMANNEIAPLKVNTVPNAKAPLTPIARLTPDAVTIEWNPIEYIAGYRVLRNGKVIKETRETTYQPTEPGEYQIIGVDGSGVESFASEPLMLFSSKPFKVANPAMEMRSSEVSYQPATPVSGYTGPGYFEIDHNAQPAVTIIDIPEDGTYAVGVRYANGNGPVNTENKCAIRSLMLDGQKVGTIVMPTRGVANWDDWGMSNYVTLHLTKGNHLLGLEYRPENENMNLGTNHALVDYFLINLLPE